MTLKPRLWPKLPLIVSNPADGNFYLNMEDENHNVLTNKWSKVDKAQGIMMYALPLPEDSNVDLMSCSHYKVREITSKAEKHGHFLGHIRIQECSQRLHG